MSRERYRDEGIALPDDDQHYSGPSAGKCEDCDSLRTHHWVRLPSLALPYVLTESTVVLCVACAKKRGWTA